MTPGESLTALALCLNAGAFLWSRRGEAKSDGAREAALEARVGVLEGELAITRKSVHDLRETVHARDAGFAAVRGALDEFKATVGRELGELRQDVKKLLRGGTES